MLKGLTTDGEIGYTTKVDVYEFGIMVFEIRKS
jgi:hypothetical protein